jgi:hypothetical protein
VLGDYPDKEDADPNKKEGKSKECILPFSEFQKTEEYKTGIYKRNGKTSR